MAAELVGNIWVVELLELIVDLFGFGVGVVQVQVEGRMMVLDIWVSYVASTVVSSPFHRMEFEIEVLSHEIQEVEVKAYIAEKGHHLKEVQLLVEKGNAIVEIRKESKVSF
ncbi:hypothetical protein M3225_28380 [Priestia aryabhattai]|nr:hypothetical protein [Priestia aryabhattai]